MPLAFTQEDFLVLRKVFRHTEKNLLAVCVSIKFHCSGEEHLCFPLIVSSEVMGSIPTGNNF